VASLAGHDGPTAFAIPGNHDWIDGLETFQRHILHKVVPMCGLVASFTTAPRLPRLRSVLPEPPDMNGSCHPNTLSASLTRARNTRKQRNKQT